MTMNFEMAKSLALGVTPNIFIDTDDLGFRLIHDRGFDELPKYSIRCPYCNQEHYIDYTSKVLYSDTISYGVDTKCPHCNRYFFTQVFAYHTIISFYNTYLYINPHKLIKDFAGCNLIVNSDYEDLYTCYNAITKEQLFSDTLKHTYEKLFDIIRGNIILQLSYSIINKTDFLRKYYKPKMQARIKTWLSNLTSVVNYPFIFSNSIIQYTSLLTHDLLEVAYSYDNNIFDKYEYTLFKIVTSMCNQGLDITIGAIAYTPITEFHFALFLPYLNSTERNIINNG